MILLFHAAYFIFKFLFRNYKCFQFHKQKSTLLALQCSCSSFDKTRDAEENLSFDPPVYRQRYSAVQQVLLDYRWKKYMRKVVEFGCAEFGMFMYLKNLLSIEKIVFVDIAEDILVDNSFKIKPLTVDYLKRRASSLSVDVYAGSVSSPDANLLHADAIIAIELIEHLYPDTLDALPYNIFAFIQPKIAIFTTPNADFNVLFPSFKKFRHYDHKFEWTREQFQSWAVNITHRFPQYTVYFENIGYGPKDTDYLGACSQMAVFVKSSIMYNWPLNQALPLCDKSHTFFDQSVESTDKNSRQKYTSYESYGVCTYQSYSTPMYDYEILPKICDYSEDIISPYEDTYYKFLESIEYPYSTEITSPEEVLKNEILYSVHLLGRVNGRYYSYDRDRSEIPLLDIVCNQQRFVTSVSEVSAVLQKAGYKIESCVDSFANETIQCVIYEPEMEANSSSSYAEESDYAGESEWESVKESDMDWNRADDGEQQFIADAQFHAETVVAEIINKIDDVNSIPSHSSSEWNTEETCTSNETAKELSCSNSDFLDLPTNFIEIEQTAENGCKHKKIEIPSVVRKKFENSSVMKTKLEGHLKMDITKENSTSVRNGLVKDLAISKKNKEDSKKTNEDLSPIIKRGKNKDGIDFSGRRSPLQDVEDVIVPGGSNIKRRKKQKRNAGECQLNRREEDDELLNERVNVDVVNAEVNLINELLDQMPQAVVENGDLVNNNRDFEGNNYPNAVRDAEEIHNEDNENQNRVDHVEENEVQEDFENRNDNNDRQPLRLRNEIQLVQDAGRNVAEGAEELPEVEHASREALFDPNSQLDLLDGFLNQQNNRDSNNVNSSQNGVVVIGINPIDEDGGVAVLPTHANPFPNWLLHLLESEELGAINLHDEPHFYCQGDGVGVHPSIIEVDLEDDSDTDSDESSHSNADENLTLQTSSNSQSDMTSFLLESDSRQGTPTLPKQNSSSSNDKNDLKPDQLAQNGILTVSSSLSDAGSSKLSIDSKNSKKLKKKATVSNSSGSQDNKEDIDIEEIEEENFAVSLSLLSNLILASTEEVYETLRSSSSSVTTSTGTEGGVPQGIEVPVASSSQNEGGDKDTQEKESSDPT